MPQNWFKCLRKKEEIVSIFVCKLRALPSPHQHLVQGDQKYNFPKITVEEPLENLESENIDGAKAPAGEDQRIRDLSLLSRKRRTCRKCTNLGPLGCFSARTIAVRRTKLIFSVILHFRPRKKAGRSRPVYVERQF